MGCIECFVVLKILIFECNVYVGVIVKEYNVILIFLGWVMNFFFGRGFLWEIGLGGCVGREIFE